MKKIKKDKKYMKKWRKEMKKKSGKKYHDNEEVSKYEDVSGIY